VSETFTARLKLKPRGWRRYPSAFTFEDLDTGEVHYMFPAELARMVEGMTFTQEFRKTRKGGYDAISPVKVDK